MANYHGLYQLFGRSFTTKDGDVVPGAGIFDLETVGDDKRIVGNIVLNSSRVWRNYWLKIILD